MTKTRNGTVYGIFTRKADGKLCTTRPWGRGQDGKIRQRQFVGRTDERAAALMGRADKAYADFLNGRIEVVPERVTVSRLIAEYVDSSRFRELSHNSQTAYKSYFKHIERALGNKRVADLTEHDVEVFQSSLTVSSKTVSLIRACLQAVLTYALSRKYVITNVARGPRSGGPRTVRFKQPDIEPFNAKEAKQLLAAFRAEPSSAGGVMELMLTGGLRHAEALGIQVQDIDWKASGPAEVRIRGQLAHTAKGYQYVNETKGRKDREVYVPASILADLKMVKGKRTEGFLFLNQGQPWQQEPVRSIFYAVLDHLGLRRGTRSVEVLRHSYATIRAAAGDSVFHISRDLGHADVSLTQKVYARWLPESKLLGAATMSKMLD